MKKKRWAALAAVLLLAAAAAAVGIYFYPSWQAAEILRERADLAHFSYELEVELDREALEAGQVKVLETLAGLTGVETQALYRFRIRGSVWEDRIHALIYPDGEAEPYLELYLSEETDVINEAMLYNIIRRNLLGQNALLNLLVPVQEKNMYMTLEQVEQMFGIDLGAVRDFRLPAASSGTGAVAESPTVWQYFGLLAALPRERQEDGLRFLLERERVLLQLEVSAEKSNPVRFALSVEEPAKAAQESREILEGLGIALPGGELEMLENLSFTVLPGEGAEIVMPTEYVSQEIIDLIAGIRKLFPGQGE